MTYEAILTGLRDKYTMVECFQRVFQPNTEAHSSPCGATSLRQGFEKIRRLVLTINLFEFRVFFREFLDGGSHGLNPPVSARLAQLWQITGKPADRVLSRATRDTARPPNALPLLCP